MRVLIALILCITYVNCEIFPECNGKLSRTYVAAAHRKNDCRSFVYCNGENSFEDMCAIGFAFNSIKLTCDPKQSFDCADDIEMNNNMSKKRIATAMTKRHPTPPGRPLMTTPKKATLRGNSNRPEPTRKPLVSSTLRTIATTQSPKKTPSPLQTELPILIPTPPGAKKFPQYSKESVSTTLPKEKEPTWLPTKPHPKTKVTSLPTMQQQNQTPLLTSSTVVAVTSDDILASIQEQCIKKSVGSFADPDDCRYYYRCMRGILSKQQCPKGFGWDAKAKMCSSKGCSK